MYFMLLIACSKPASPPATPALERLMAVLDQNGDHVLSETEFREIAHPDLGFAQADRDGNQSINVHELELLIRSRSPLLRTHQDPGLSR